VSDLPVPYERGAFSRLERKQAVFKRNKLQHDTDYANERLRAQRKIDEERLDAMAHLGIRAIQNAGFVTRVEDSVARLSPTNAERVRALGDITALALAEILTDARRRLE
jgi:3-methyladenine DNA glycosylase AlkD